MLACAAHASPMPSRNAESFLEKTTICAALDQVEAKEAAAADFQSFDPSRAKRHSYCTWAQPSGAAVTVWKSKSLGLS